MDTIREDVLFIRIQKIISFHLRKMVRSELFVDIQTIHTMTQLHLLDESVRISIATNHKKQYFPLINFISLPRSWNKLLSFFIYKGSTAQEQQPHFYWSNTSRENIAIACKSPWIALPLSKTVILLEFTLNISEKQKDLKDYFKKL